MVLLGHDQNGHQLCANHGQHQNWQDLQSVSKHGRPKRMGISCWTTCALLLMKSAHTNSRYSNHHLQKYLQKYQENEPLECKEYIAALKAKIKAPPQSFVLQFLLRLG